MNGTTFADYDIDAPEFGTGEHRTRCPKCEPEHKTRGQKDLSVNLSDGTWFCHRCGWKGGLKPEKIFPTGTRPKAQSPSRRTELATESNSGIDSEFAKLKPLTAAALAYLSGRGISEDTAALAGLKSAEAYSHRAGKKLETIAFPVMRGGGCVNIKYRPLEIKDFLQSKGGDQAALFNGDSMEDAETIIFSEGEIDALSVLECGYPCSVSCPNGAPPIGAKNLENKLAWLESNRAAFDAAGRVILAMDKDEPGLAFERIVADRIGLQKCYTVDYPAGCKDANDCLTQYGKSALIAAIDNAKPYPIPGITDFNEHAAEIMDYWHDRGRRNLFSTGFPGIDRYCLLQPGTLNILTGVPSHGKSEFLDQIIINTVRRYRWPWVVFSPENYPIPNHFQKLAEKWMEKPFFNPGTNSTWSIEAMNEPEVAAAIAELTPLVKILTAGNDSGDDLNGILRRVEVCIRRDGARAFVLDPWNEIEHKRPANLTETEYISQALTTCRNFARRFNVMCWIVAHPTKLQKDKLTGIYPVPTAWDISGSANWRNKADVCLCVWRDVAKDDGVLQLHIQKVRNKNAGRAGEVVSLNWCRANGCIADAPKYQMEGE